MEKRIISGISVQSITHNNQKYFLCLPPKTGTRSFHRMLYRQRLLNIPSYITLINTNLQHNALPPNHYSLQYAPDIRHSSVPKDFTGNIVVTVRNPLDRISSLYAMAREEDYVARGQIKNIDLSPTQLIELFLKIMEQASFKCSLPTTNDRSKLLHHAQFIIYYHFLMQRAPQYIIRCEAQEQDILKLPFIANLDEYNRCDGYDKGGEEQRFRVKENKEQIKDYILSNQEWINKINEYFHMDFELFGYRML